MNFCFLLYKLMFSVVYNIIKKYFLLVYNYISPIFKYIFSKLKYAFTHYVTVLNPYTYINAYKERVSRYEKIKALDDKWDKFHLDRLEKEESKKKEDENKKILEIANVKEKKQKEYKEFKKKFEKNKVNILNRTVHFLFNQFGAKSVKGFKQYGYWTKKIVHKKDAIDVFKNRHIYKWTDEEVTLELIIRTGKRYNFNDIDVLCVIPIAPSNFVKSKLKIPYEKASKETKKKYQDKYMELLRIYRNILYYKTELHTIKQKKLEAKRELLLRVLHVLLYVDQIDAENINERYAKMFFYTRDVNYNFRIRSNNIKVRSLEWTTSSPPPLHTFYVPVRTFVTNDRFYNYKKGKRLLRNEKYYNFSETPSILQKIYRKLSKTFFLFINYIYHVLGLKDFSKDPNLWYSGSHNVVNVEEYTHTVEYVSQAVRYPYRHLSKHLPFSSGLHKNTISIDLLITPDKSNKVIFGEKKYYMTKPSFIKKNNDIIKPSFIIGDRKAILSKVLLNKLDCTYDNYLLVMYNTINELINKGDGPNTSYYLPELNKNNVHFFLWSNSTIESPCRTNYFFYKIDQFKHNTLHDNIDFNCFMNDVRKKYSHMFNFLPKRLTNIFVSFFMKWNQLKQNSKYNIFISDWMDQIEFSNSIEYVYFYLYIPYMISKKINKPLYFYKYLILEYGIKSLIGITPIINLFDAIKFELIHIINIIKNKYNK